MYQNHQPTSYCRASQQLCISLHVLFMSCVSSMISRHFSAVVMCLPVLFILAGSSITLLSGFVITFFYCCVFLKFLCLGCPILYTWGMELPGSFELDEGSVGNCTCQMQLILGLSIPAFLCLIWRLLCGC